MPSNIVKTKSDEKKWNRAKKKVKEQQDIDSDGEVPWALVNHIFQNMKSSKKK